MPRRPCLIQLDYVSLIPPYFKEEKEAQAEKYLFLALLFKSLGPSGKEPSPSGDYGFGNIYNESDPDSQINDNSLGRGPGRQGIRKGRELAGKGGL